MSRPRNYIAHLWLAMLLVIFALVCVVAFKSNAHAGEWELSAGMTQAPDTKNGTWYQNGLPHHLQMRSPSFGMDYRQSVVVPDNIVYPTGQRIVSTATTAQPIHISYMAALQVNVRNVGARFSVFDARAYQRGACMPGIYDGGAFNGSIIWRFQ